MSDVRTALTKLTDEETAQLYGYCMGKPAMYALLRRLVTYGVQEDPDTCDVVPSNERLQEAEALIAMLSNDMDQHDFTRGYLPHWRPRLRAFLEGRPATYDPKDAPPRPSETFGESPHDITCNYRRGPLFGEGCICKVVNKHEYARMEQQLPKNPCRHTAAKAEAIRKGLDHITCGCGVTLSAQKSEASREPLPIRKSPQ